MRCNLLFEIGTEEIPARFMEPALKQLQELAQEKLTAERIDFSTIKVYGTPRRLALFVQGVAPKQRDKIVETKGPARRSAFDAEGQPTKAATGFARGQGVSVSDLEIRETPQGEYLFAMKQVTGQPTREVLPEILPALITSLNFPKPMRWGYSDMRFARPIHWLVALLGEEVIPFELNGITSDRITRGHRFLGQKQISLAQADDYLLRLADNFVLADQEERKALIWQQIETLAQQEGGRVDPDEELLTEVTYLLEYPTALAGKIEEKYLALPEEVVITPMREHQRYFPVRNQQGKLMAKFITLRNGTAEYLATVREGNEKVLRARLADAQFFYTEDLKIPLDQNVEKLSKIVFHEDLGMLSAKVQRVRAIAAYLGQKLGLAPECLQDLDRTAFLAKADLVTNMVYEFPELEGIMGAEYARQAGEKDEVSQAILEHYQPRQAGGALPSTELGMIVSIADKIDSIVGCFAVGIQPTGSQDPYALRRQALGICRIMLQEDSAVSLTNLIIQAFQQYAQGGEVRLKLDQEQVVSEVREFFKLRLRNLLSDQGIRYDTLDAVFAVDFDHIPSLQRRAVCIQEFRAEPLFNDLITTLIRAHNLARHAQSETIDESLLIEPAELTLFKALAKAQTEVHAAQEQQELPRILEIIARLQEPLSHFFEGVMVMVEDQNLQNNRLALLRQVSKLGIGIADFSLLVVS